MAGGERFGGQRFSTDFDLLGNLLADLKDHDKVTFYHSLRVAYMAQLFAEYLGYKCREDLEDVFLAGLLHDLGKLSVTPDILIKPEKLDVYETRIMSGHSAAGAEIVRRNFGGRLVNLSSVVDNHHAPVDNLGNSRESIITRIISVVDVFDAARDETRPYHRGKRDVTYFIFEDMRSRVEGGELDGLAVEKFVDFWNEYKGDVYTATYIPSTLELIVYEMLGREDFIVGPRYLNSELFEKLETTGGGFGAGVEELNNLPCRRIGD